MFHVNFLLSQCKIQLMGTNLKSALDKISTFVPVATEVTSGAYNAAGEIIGTTVYLNILLPVAEGEKYLVKTWMPYNIACTQFMDAQMQRVSIPLNGNPDYATNPYVEGVVTVPAGVSYLNVNSLERYNPVALLYQPNATEAIQDALLTRLEINEPINKKIWSISNSVVTFIDVTNAEMYGLTDPILLPEGSYIITNPGVNTRVFSQRLDGTWIYTGVSEADWRRDGTYKASENQLVYLSFRASSVGVSDILDFVEVKITSDLGVRVDELEEQVSVLLEPEKDTLPIANWRNGSVPNPGNIYAVSTVDYIPVKPEDIVTLIINKEIADDEVYSVGGRFYNTEQTSVVAWDVGVTSIERCFKVPRNGAYVQFSLQKFKINGEHGEILRASDMSADDVIVVFDNYKSAVERNTDALPSIAAASNWNFNRKCFSALVCTDLHGDIGRTTAWMRYLNYSVIVTVGICLGDIANSYYTDTDGAWYTDIVNESTKNVYTAIGNHDNWGATGTNNSFTRWIQPTLKQIGIEDLTTPYYAVNRTDYPITIIVLDNYDHPTDTTTENNGHIDTMSQRQLDWLITTFNSVPANNTVLICRHAVTAENTPVECAFSQPGRTVSGNGSVYGTQPIIEKIVDAWMNGASINESFAPIDAYNNYPTLTVNADFSGRGVGLFAGYAVGHTHADIISKITDYPDQNIFCFTTSSADMSQQQSGDLPRVPADKTIDAITVLSIDTTDKLVKLVRLGSDKTTHMTNRSVIAIPY